jgi:hypothetical protein
MSINPQLRGHTLAAATQEDSGSGSAGTGGGKGGDSGDRQKGDLVERLREGVESVVLLNSEMSHIQRQLLTSLALQVGDWEGFPWA